MLAHGYFVSGKKARRFTLLCILLLPITLVVTAQQPQGHALLVGVRSTTALSTSGKQYSTLATTGVERDLAKMRSLLLAASFHSTDIVELKGPAQTTVQSILTNLEVLRQKAKPGDLVVFYFSGHGDSIPDINRDEKDRFDELLVASDSSLIDDRLQNLWPRFAPDVRLVMIVDACHAGSSHALIDHMIVRSDDGRRPANESNTRSRNRTGGMAVDRFRHEENFERSSIRIAGRCMDVRTDANQPYQMIYMSASRDPSTAQGNENGGIFTRKVFDSAGGGDPGHLFTQSYRQLCESINTCPSGITYAEIGVLNSQFRTSHLFQIR